MSSTAHTQRDSRIGIRIQGIKCLECKISDVSTIKDFVIRFILHQNHNIVIKVKVATRFKRMFLCATKAHTHTQTRACAQQTNFTKKKKQRKKAPTF